MRKTGEWLGIVGGVLFAVGGLIAFGKLLDEVGREHGAIGVALTFAGFGLVVFVVGFAFWQRANVTDERAEARKALKERYDR